jgi:hypothetical protein
MNWPGIQTPFPISCNGTCCKAINTEVSLGYTASNLGNMLICGCFIFGFVYLLFKLNKTYQKFTILRVYHLYSLFVTIWFVLQALEVVVPMGALVSMIISRVLFIGHAMWDNLLVSIAFFPYSDKNAFRKAFFIACSLTTAKVALMFTYSFDHGCDVCHLFFPGNNSYIYIYIYR